MNRVTSSKLPVMVSQYRNTTVTANSEQKNMIKNLQNNIANSGAIFDRMSIIHDENKEQTQRRKGIVV